MTIFKLAATAAVATGTLSLAATSASAGTIGNCVVGDVTAASATASACEDFSGNDIGGQGTLIPNLNNGTAFSSQLSGLNGTWSILASVFNDNPSDDFGPAAVTSSDRLSGTWSILDGLQLDSPFVISLKGGPGYSAYLFQNVNDVTSGTFALDGSPELSHFTVATFTPDSTEPVPEPLTILGTAAAAGIGYGLKRKRDEILAQEDA